MKLFLVIFIFWSSQTFGFISIFEPNIECTVIKVHSEIKALGFKKFPTLYLSINNKPIDSKLLIGKKKFDRLSPKTVIKTESYEKIIIKHDEGQLELELKGKPMSRNGTLSESGKLIADITCH